MTPRNESEKYVYSIVHRSALTLWSYANPLKGKSGKELCDVLIMYDPHIAILSVKDIYLIGTNEVDLTRWRRHAIEESVSQLYGAERWLKSATHIIRSDGKIGLPISSTSKTNIFRIAIALGSKGKVPFTSQDFGKGYVHVFDDKAFNIILNELDTATDLFNYLYAKSCLIDESSHNHLEGGEEDLLAYYLANKHSFPSSSGVVSVNQGIWDDFNSRLENKARKAANRVSLVWDNLIETIAHDAITGRLEFGGTLSNTEMVLRYMASEDRYQRRLLSMVNKDFLEKSATTAISRLAVSSSGITYVFLAMPHGTDRRDRATELLARCFVARGKIRGNRTVVGIATEQYRRGRGFSLDVGLLSKINWTNEDEKALCELQSLNPIFISEMKSGFDEPEFSKTTS